jgi:2-polyprenyl-3-methyl-5-hydroxy-6-metoxy-1,4-benzoquinol methylase
MDGRLIGAVHVTAARLRFLLNVKGCVWAARGALQALAGKSETCKTMGRNMGETHYIASQTAEAFERERLGLLERIADPISQRRLTAFGIQKGWRCLEVGAGHGSIARWLAEQVGPQGRIVATDLNTRFLHELELSNLEVRQHDIVSEDLEAASYDLVHCRSVLEHLRDPQAALGRMATAVRPGGWLCLEDGDFGTLEAVEATPQDAERFTQKWRAICTAVRAAKVMDPYFGRHLRGLVETLGFREVGNEGVTWVARGGDDGARFMHLSVALVRQPMISAGVLTEEDCGVFERL